MPVSYKITGLDKVIARYKAMADRLGPSKLAKQANVVSNKMFAGVMENFEKAVSPEGYKWEALKPSTIARRRKGSSKPLQDTGMLRSSIQPKSEGTNSIVYTRMVYAAIQNYGGKAGRGRKISIPKREFMGISRERHENILTYLMGYYSGN